MVLKTSVFLADDTDGLRILTSFNTSGAKNTFAWLSDNRSGAEINGMRTDLPLIAQRTLHIQLFGSDLEARSSRFWSRSGSLVGDEPESTPAHCGEPG